MPVVKTSTLPPGMRERTFALKSYPGGETVTFGRGTDFPASNYTFPSIEATTESYRSPGIHSTAFGGTSLTPDYFEAEIGALEPNAAGKLDRLARAWNLPNFRRVSGERHELYYVLGGRARLMYGKPGRIGFTHHGYKTSYHEAILRFTPSNPFFYSADEIDANGPAFVAATNSSQTFTVPLGDFPATDIPTMAQIRVQGTAKKVTISDGPRVLLTLNNLAGTFILDNYPGYSRTTYQGPGANQPLVSGADLIGVETPSFRGCTINPGQASLSIKVDSGDTVANTNYSVKWRNAYGSP